MRRRYWLRLLAAAVVLLAAALVLAPVALGWGLMWAVTHSPCAPGGDPAAYGLGPDFEDIAFDSTDGLRLSGYFFPGRGGATVIIAPALGNGRGAALEDAAILNRAGFNVLAFGSRRCVGGPYTSLGYEEGDDVVAAYHYLAARGDVDPDRVGAHGFSAGGAAALFAAARLPALRAVSAMGGYHDFAEQLGLGQGGDVLVRLLRLGAAESYRSTTGLDVRVLRPLDAVGEIAPRPILLIYGSREVSLPGARAMLARAEGAGARATLWVVEGAGHGDYRAVAGAEYDRHLTAFYTGNLASDAASESSGMDSR